MKLQHLAIIFIIIIIPIILVFSYFLDLEASTIKTQTEYDEKLMEAASEAMEAYEINTVDWATNYNSLFNMRRKNVTRSIDIFIKSLSNKLGVGGTLKDNILTYIPAVVYTMYDGYYIYSPTYVPKNITFKSDAETAILEGKQVFYYPDAEAGFEFSTDATHDLTAGQPIFKYRQGSAEPPTGQYKGEDFTVDLEYAETEFKHVLKTFVPYSIQYNKKYTINYTLDNYIRVFGEVSREGYILGEDCSTDHQTLFANKTNGVTINNITPERLTENVAIKNGDNIEIQEYPYIYTSKNDKIYYDDDGFFDIVGDYKKEYLQKVDANNSQAKFKKLLIRTSKTAIEYDEVYQLLNIDEGNKWYIKDSTGALTEYTKHTIRVEKDYDCSAINYWTECYCFNSWLDGMLFDRDYIISERQKTIIDNINNNLSLSIASYSKNSRAQYTIPQLSDENWEQALSNISIIAFFQGVKIGLRTYSNYAIVSSSENNEFVTDESIYYVDTEDEYYHRYSCDVVTSSHGTVQGYKNTEFKEKSYGQSTGIKYYYKHNGINNEGSSYGKQECFYCIVNRNIMKSQEYTWWNKIKETAIAREKYIQMSRTRLTETSTKKTVSVNYKVKLNDNIVAQGKTYYNRDININAAIGDLFYIELEVDGRDDETYKFNIWRNMSNEYTNGNAISASYFGSVEDFYGQDTIKWYVNNNNNSQILTFRVIFQIN